MASRQQVIVHQFLPMATPRDAITNQALLIRNALREASIPGDIFAAEIGPGAKAFTRQYPDRKLWNCDLMLLHHSTGWNGLKSLLKIPIPKQLVYHNITPEHFFAHDPLVARRCRLGRAQISLLRNHIVGSFADSRFNSRELESEGYEPSLILPLVDLGARRPPVSTRTTIGLAEMTRLVFVGRVTRHKNQALLVRTLHWLRETEGLNAELLLLGSHEPIYSRYVRLLARALGIDRHVKMTGSVADGELAMTLHSADAFVCVSEHEGFCVPLVEAMAADVPIFAWHAGAVAETLGGAGIRLTSLEPSLVARQIRLALAAPERIEHVLASQRERHAVLSKTQTSQQIVNLIQQAIVRLREPPRRPAEKKRRRPNAPEVALDATS